MCARLYRSERESESEEGKDTGEMHLIYNGYNNTFRLNSPLK